MEESTWLRSTNLLEVSEMRVLFAPTRVATSVCHRAISGTSYAAISASFRRLSAQLEGRPQSMPGSSGLPGTLRPWLKSREFLPITAHRRTSSCASRTPTRRVPSTVRFSGGVRTERLARVRRARVDSTWAFTIATRPRSSKCSSPSPTLTPPSRGWRSWAGELSARYMRTTPGSGGGWSAKTTKGCVSGYASPQDDRPRSALEAASWRATSPRSGREGTVRTGR